MLVISLMEMLPELSRSVLRKMYLASSSVMGAMLCRNLKYCSKFSSLFCSLYPKAASSSVMLCFCIRFRSSLVIICFSFFFSNLSSSPSAVNSPLKIGWEYNYYQEILSYSLFCKHFSIKSIVLAERSVLLMCKGVFSITRISSDMVSVLHGVSPCSNS